MPLRLVILAAALACAACLPGSARAQAPAGPVPTNRAVFERLAVDCLGAVPGDAEAFRLASAERLPFLRTALVAGWQEAGRSVFEETAEAALPLLRYQIDEARVRYERAGRGARAREVTLRLRYGWTLADGRLAAEAECAEPYRDEVGAAAIPLLEDRAFGETVGIPPRAPRWRRYGEPLVIAAAIGVGTALLFSVRSDATQ
jgi:hypothetical protein